MYSHSPTAAWLADTPLLVPLSYFSSLQPSGNYIVQEPDSVLYSYANQLFGWGAFPEDSLRQEFRSVAVNGHIWLLAPTDWEQSLAELYRHNSPALREVKQLNHMSCQSPVESIILPSGMYSSPITEYNDDIGNLFRLFEKEQKLSGTVIEPAQQIEAINTHGQCWGLFREQQLLGKLDILYPAGESAWGGGLVLIPELRGKKLGSTFLLHQHQQSPYSRMEIQVSSELLPYYLQIGYRSLIPFCWYQLV
jgi:hypothetical protein